MQPISLERLKLVLREKTRFITRLLQLLENYHPVVTQPPLAAWDQISEGDYVPPHAHLMMVLEGMGWKRAGRGWEKDRVFLPLWWVWGVPADSIVMDTTKVVDLLQRTAKEHQELATNEEWLRMVQESQS